MHNKPDSDKYDNMLSFVGPDFKNIYLYRQI